MNTGVQVQPANPHAVVAQQAIFHMICMRLVIDFPPPVNEQEQQPPPPVAPAVTFRSLTFFEIVRVRPTGAWAKISMRADILPFYGRRHWRFLWQLPEPEDARIKLAPELLHFRVCLGQRFMALTDARIPRASSQENQECG